MPNFFTIGTLGTSLTIGSGSTESFHRQLEAALRPGKQSIIRSYNMGTAGGITPDGIAQVNRLGNLRPNVILIEFSMNDCLRTFATAEDETNDLIDLLVAKTPNSALYLMTMNTVVGSSLSATSRAPTLPTFYQMYRDIAALRNDVGLIDTYPAWSGATLTDMPDGIHPTPAANLSRLIPTIVAALSPMIT